MENLAIQLLWGTLQLLVTHVSLIYLEDRLFCLFLVLLNEIEILGESKVFHSVSDVNQGNEEENVVSVVQK